MKVSKGPLLRTTEAVIGALAVIAGWCLLGLSCLIVFESFARKFFGFSVQGADEIGGYVLAIMTSIGFSYALIGRAHIRIDLVYQRVPAWVQFALNLLAYAMLSSFATILAWRALSVAIESAEMHALAPTLLRTPLMLPQGIWAAFLVLFCAVSCCSLVAIAWLAISGQVKRAATQFGISSVEEELADELADVQRRMDAGK